MGMLAALATWTKDNPLATLGGAAVALIAGAAAIDDRYAHAGDVREQTQTISQALEINRLTAEVSVLQLRRQSLEDRVFDLNVKVGSSVGQRAAGEAASLQRYQTELRDVIAQQRAKQELIDKLRTAR